MLIGVRADETCRLGLLTQLTAAADVDWSQRRLYVKPRTDHHHHAFHALTGGRI